MSSLLGHGTKTLYELLSEVAKTRPDKTAIVDGERTLDYKGLFRKANSLVAELKGLGLRKGDAVALLIPNGIEFVTSFLAVTEFGAIVVPLNVGYKKTEIARIINDCGSKALITLEEFKDLGHQVIEDTVGELELLLMNNAETAESSTVRNRQILQDSETTTHHAEAHVLYQFSSGSTGVPKRVARSNSNLVFELESLAKTLALNDEDRFLGVAPFSHVNGLVRSMLASLSSGATLFTLRDFKRRQVVDMIQREKINAFIGVPSMFSALAETTFPQPIDLSSLRLCFSSSAPMPVQANQLFREKYGFYVRQLYGSTETGTICANLSDQLQESLGSVGRPIEGVDISILRSDHTPTRATETGEVVVRSPAVFAGYQTARDRSESFKNEYFLTGDLGNIDEKGNLYLTGRKKLFINRGGYKVNPLEVESVLQSHPGVKQVAVIGVPGRFGDERVKAIVVRQLCCTERDIIEYCRERLASFKLPSLVEFRESLPTTPTGKLLRSNLK